MEEDIKNKLFSLADSKYKEFHSGLCPNTNNIIGVRIPILRQYAKELLKDNTLEELLENIGNQYYEEIMLQGMIIGLSNEKNFEKILIYVKQFIPKIDNWAVCDTFCAGLKITKKYKNEMWEFIKQYLKSNKEFELRFCIVMMLDYYIDEEHIDKILEILDNIKSDKYYVQMAVAWAISICIIKFYDKTVEYLKVSNLDEFTYRKSIQKAIESYRISDERKQILKKLKNTFAKNNICDIVET